MEGAGRNGWSQKFPQALSIRELAWKITSNELGEGGERGIQQILLSDSPVGGSLPPCGQCPGFIPVSFPPVPTLVMS